ncbi:Plastid-lipid associated protein PAP / fibrillin family protein [Perilla frutescens var. frutescens]|nr:Plastid-lipid associated protein PAP / fibrillin family protein [Perilla frutescens var. frutescens]
MTILHLSPSSSATLLHSSTVAYSATIFSPKRGLHFSSNHHSRDASLNRSQEFPISDKWRTGVSFFSPFLNKSSEIESLKQQLLDAIAPLDRGAAATAEDQRLVDQIACKLEATNKVKEPLKSTLLNGKWELLYTTSKSILQTERPKIFRPNGKIYQAINLDTLRAQNIETWPFFNQATANLVPLNSRRVAVKFDSFKVAGVIPINARGSGRGQLEITYLDEELRISRGNQGNLFILRMVNPFYRVPV